MFHSFKLPKNLTKNQILEDIKSWIKYVPDDKKKYYYNLCQIINGNFNFSLKDEIRKLMAKKESINYKEGERAKNLQSHIPYVSYNTREIARKAEYNYLYNKNYKPEVKLYQKADQELLNKLSQDVHYKGNELEEYL